jgi:threonine/homoserine/homoserine lactone efflux protein
MFTAFSMLWRGVAIGVMVSAPMGPVGMLCIQRTLDKGRRPGLYTGIGAAISDLFYCLLTGFGLSFIEDFLERHQNVIQLLGSLFLVVYGIYLFKKNPSRSLQNHGLENRGSPKKDILGGFLFTFSNPLILFLIIGLFARFNFTGPDLMYYHYIVGYVAIACGALGWWWIVTYFVNKVRSHFNIRSMWLINKIIGTLMLLFAFVGIASAVMAMTSAKASAHVVRESPMQEFKILFNDSSTLTLNNIGEDFSYTLIPRAILSDDFEWVANVSDNHFSLKYKYIYYDVSGQYHLISSPGWGMVAGDPDAGAFVMAFLRREEVKTSKYMDETSTRFVLEVRWRDDASSESSDTLVVKDGEFRSQPSTVSLALTRKDGVWTVSAGASSLVKLWSGTPMLNEISKIGFALPPAAEITVNRTSLHHYATANLQTRWCGDIDALLAHLRRSSDYVEGVYAQLDYDMDESLLRLGGNYRVAVVADDSAEKTYSIIYLDGARVKNSKWIPGMMKGVLTPLSTPGVFSLRWFDADMVPLEKDLSATMVDRNTLSLLFPYQNSTLRLQKVAISKIFY